jgi:hypothetical protein
VLMRSKVMTNAQLAVRQSQYTEEQWILIEQRERIHLLRDLLTRVVAQDRLRIPNNLRTAINTELDIPDW